MSGHGCGTRSKGRLIQSKLSFTSTSSTGACGKLPESGLDKNTPATDKGKKRRMDGDGGDEKDQKRIRCLEAAEKRKNTQADKSSSESPTDYQKSNQEIGKSLLEEQEQPEPSTSAAGEGRTQEYAMSEPEEICANDSQNFNESPDSSGGEEDDEAEIESSKPKPRGLDPGKGKPINELNTEPGCLPPDLKLDRSQNHEFLIKLPFEYSENSLPKPFPQQYQDRWDEHHVRMPCSDKSKYPLDTEGSDVKLAERWDMIKQALEVPISDSFTLEEAILSYNQRYTNKWKFTALHHYFSRHIERSRRDQFFEAVLPLMVKLALKLPYICTKSIPLLKKGKPRKLTLSQQQIACLLANAFFCTFPRRNSRAKNAEYSSYPDINFSNLFQGQPIPRKMEKLNCIIHYFTRICYDMPKGIVTFSRQTVSRPYDWRNSDNCLKALHVSSSGTIEDNGIGMLQVDFANKYLGGGVLGHGCVQEEIRFLICPEMIVTRLFTEALGDQDSLIMTGCEQFSKYDGYADTFTWTGDFQDKTERDPVGRLCCEVVAIDAMVFRSDYKKQFKTNPVLRELNKAYCGFLSNEKETHKTAVCTGNWGCGAFGGDKQLKSLIQLMAASAAKRDVCYFTFGDEKLADELYQIHGILVSDEIPIRRIMQLIADYERLVVSRSSSSRPYMGLFEFIVSKLGYADSQDSDIPSPGQSFDEDSNEGRSGAWDSTVDGGTSPDYRANTP